MESIIFPLILSGPIIRRTDISAITIWIATSRPVNIKGQLYKLLNEVNHDEPHEIATVTEAKSISAGKNLFIHLLTLKPKEKPFPTNHLLGYNLHFYEKERHFDLGTLGLLNPAIERSIVYGQLPYPSFFIKDKRSNQHHISYGSCRKPHGEGEDTLPNVDFLLEQYHNDLSKRPEALFLMGDQIYADDVADPLFQLIRFYSKAIIGDKEDLTELDERLSLQPFRKSLEQINGRSFIMEHLCEFTSTHSSNHLMRWSEFAVMYLLSWGPQLWEISRKLGIQSSFNDAMINKEIYFVFPDVTPFHKKHKLEKLQLQKRFEHQQESLITFQLDTYKVRRLFANIPVYMIFDDHDITDDWNLSHDWKKKVWDSPLGRHVVSNGLDAYWMFQGWGNNPEVFEDDFFHTVKEFHEAEETTKDRETWTKVLWEYENWHFVAPTNPPTVFLDTRTQRLYEWNPRPIMIGGKIEETVASPHLLKPQAWENVHRLLLEAGFKHNTPLIVVSPAPVYGLGLIETVLDRYVYPLRTIGIDMQNILDFEAWKYNGKGFTTFLQQIGSWNPEYCIILSGDVHSASAVSANITFSNGELLKIHQFTSSPTKNISYSGIGGLLIKTFLMRNEFRRKKDSIHRFCTKDYHILNGDPQELPTRWTDAITYHPVTKGSLIDTQNNIGLLTITSKGEIHNQLFHRMKD
ncbi:MULTISPECIES: hypothetical protein [unclassified Bacillus (in: firmicutes)]|uniref:hypothetical protein n=1 Tax=unclassified Bacillus (in: firmicutes) TaxID=185979 RepID=UPI0008EC660F|nr:MULTISPECIES: hypothetical protein [unclassified Bacillus (in: firmicutes)]SFA85304.1 hypothetical protein SAMN02799634_10215 [Bacillus sp. UNCCL13]SFQ83351.1 hypothetical protein SAMN04488577_2135 [Bacillus sp. cl95]